MQFLLAYVKRKNVIRSSVWLKLLNIWINYFAAINQFVCLHWFNRVRKKMKVIDFPIQIGRKSSSDMHMTMLWKIESAHKIAIEFFVMPDSINNTDSTFEYWSVADIYLAIYVHNTHENLITAMSIRQ